jgi:predicted RNA binding protein YcfA (HicA-like mRNA interferase family)
MSKFGNVRPKDVLRALEKCGFIRVKTVGSHVSFRHINGHRTTIPLHTKTLGKGLLHKILKQAGLSIDELKRAMK